MQKAVQVHQPSEVKHISVLTLRNFDDRLLNVEMKLDDLNAKLDHLISSHDLTVMALPKTRIPVHAVTRGLNDFDTEE